VRTVREFASAVRWLIGLIGREDIDVVYSNTLGVFAGLVAAKLRRVPHVHHVHEILTKPKVLARTMGWIACWGSTLVIANADATARNLPRRCHRKSRLTVVHNGIDLARFDAAVHEGFRRELGIDESVFVIAFAGRIGQWKGQDHLIDAAALLKDSGDGDFAVVIAGDTYAGYEYLIDELHAQVAACGLGEHVHFLGQRRDIPSLLTDADVVVVPSAHPESFGLVVVEGMAAGRPVVATAHGGPVEIVEDGVTGFLVPPARPESIAARLRELMSDRGLGTRMGAAGRRRVEKHFTAAVAMQAIVAAVNRVLADPSTGSDGPGPSPEASE
jgi:glycosyltransferase involved in cell wall biosynthesis